MDAARDFAGGIHFFSSDAGRQWPLYCRELSDFISVFRKARFRTR